jgi:hypothetical protein
MEQEFFFNSEAIQKATRDGIKNGMAYLLAFSLVFFLLFHTELQWNVGLQNSHIGLLLFTVFLSVASISSSRNRLLASRIFLTDEGLDFSAGAIKLKIPFENISRVDHIKNAIVIYSKSSGSFPVFALFNLDKQEEFLETIGRHALITKTGRIPWLLNSTLRAAVIFIFFASLLVQLLFSSPYFIFGSGLLICSLMIFQLITLANLKKFQLSPGLIFIILLLVLLLLRCGLVIWKGFYTV